MLSWNSFASCVEDIETLFTDKLILNVGVLFIYVVAEASCILKYVQAQYGHTNFVLCDFVAL